MRTCKSISRSELSLLTTWTDRSFLDLMATSPAEFFVPTLDIDLAWHTHQLMAKNYRTDCTTYVGRFIDQ